MLLLLYLYGRETDFFLLITMSLCDIDHRDLPNADTQELFQKHLHLKQVFLLEGVGRRAIVASFGLSGGPDHNLHFQAVCSIYHRTIGVKLP